MMSPKHKKGHDSFTLISKLSVNRVGPKSSYKITAFSLSYIAPLFGNQHIHVYLAVLADREQSQSGFALPFPQQTTKDAWQSEGPRDFLLH